MKSIMLQALKVLPSLMLPTGTQVLTQCSVQGNRALCLLAGTPMLQATRWWNAACAGTVSAAAGLSVTIPQEGDKLTSSQFPGTSSFTAAQSLAPQSLCSQPLCFSSCLELPFALRLLPLPQLGSLLFHLLSFFLCFHIQQHKNNLSFPYLIINVRSLCFNEPSLDPLEDGFLATTKHQPAENQD